MALSAQPAALWLRVIRRGSAFEIAYALDGMNYTLLRLAYLTSTEQVQVGPMCAAPQGAGFDLSFEGFTVRPVAASDHTSAA